MPSASWTVSALLLLLAMSGASAALPLLRQSNSTTSPTTCSGESLDVLAVLTDLLVTVVSEVMHPELSSATCDTAAQTHEMQRLWEWMFDESAPWNCSSSVVCYLGSPTCAGFLNYDCSLLSSCVVALEFDVEFSNKYRKVDLILNSSTLGPQLRSTVETIDVGGNPRLKVDLADLLNSTSGPVLRYVNTLGTQVVSSSPAPIVNQSLAMRILLLDGAQNFELPGANLMPHLVGVFCNGSLQEANLVVDQWLANSPHLRLLWLQTLGFTRLPASVCQAANLQALSLSSTGFDGSFRSISDCATTLPKLALIAAQNQNHLANATNLDAGFARTLSGGTIPLSILLGGSGVYGPAHVPNRTFVLDLSTTLITEIVGLTTLVNVCWLVTKSSPYFTVPTAWNATVPALQYMDISGANYLAPIHLVARALQYCRVCDANATTLTLSDAVNLTKLSVANSFLTALHITESSTGRPMKELPLLTLLWASDNAFQADWLNHFPLAPQITMLYLDNTGMTLPSLSRFLTSPSNLTVLSFARNKLVGDFSAEAEFLNWIKKTPSLVVLDFRGNGWLTHLTLDHFLQPQAPNFTSSGIGYLALPSRTNPIKLTVPNDGCFTRDELWIVRCAQRLQTLYPSECTIVPSLAYHDNLNDPDSTSLNSVRFSFRRTPVRDISDVCAQYGDLPAIITPSDAVRVEILPASWDGVDDSVATINTSIQSVVGSASVDLTDYIATLNYAVPQPLVATVSSFADPNPFSQGIGDARLTVTRWSCDDKRRYAVQGTNHCTPCPIGCTCDGTPYPTQDPYMNYWCQPVGDGTYTATRCNDFQLNCVSGVRGQSCKDGYTGDRCVSCASGYGRSIQDRTCQPCETDGGVVLVVFIIIVPLMVIIGLLGFALVGAQPDRISKESDPRFQRFIRLYQLVLVRGAPMILGLLVYSRSTYIADRRIMPIAQVGTALLPFASTKSAISCAASSAGLSREAQLWVPLMLCWLVWLVVLAVAFAILWLRRNSKAPTMQTRAYLAFQALNSVFAASTPFLVSQITPTNMDVNAPDVDNRFASDPSVLYGGSNLSLVVLTSVVILSPMVTVFVAFVTQHGRPLIANSTLWYKWRHGNGEEEQFLLTDAPTEQNTNVVPTVPNQTLAVDVVFNTCAAIGSSLWLSDMSVTGPAVMILVVIHQAVASYWEHDVAQVNWVQYVEGKSIPLPVIAYEHAIERHGYVSRGCAMVLLGLAVCQDSLRRRSGLRICADVLVITLSLFFAAHASVCADTRRKSFDEYEAAARAPLHVRPRFTLRSLPRRIWVTVGATLVFNVILSVVANAHNWPSEGSRWHSAFAAVNVIPMLILVTLDFGAKGPDAEEHARSDGNAAARNSVSPTTDGTFGNTGHGTVPRAGTGQPVAGQGTKQTKGESNVLYFGASAHARGDDEASLLRD